MVPMLKGFSSFIAALLVIALISNACEAYSFICSLNRFGLGQRSAIGHPMRCHRQDFLSIPERRASFLDDTEIWPPCPRRIIRKQESTQWSVCCYRLSDIVSGFPSVRFRRKEISRRMAATPAPFTNFSSALEYQNSNIEILRVVPGEYDVRALADLCCRSFYGEHQWWSSVLNPISGMQRIMLFEKILADLSNRILKHRLEGCGALYLAIETSTGEAVGDLIAVTADAFFDL
jgi:hypothetical protein